MATSTFRTDLRELKFQLFEHLEVGTLCGRGPYADFSEDIFSMTLDEAERMAREVLGTCNAEGDRTGARFENGRVTVPPAYRDAWRTYVDNGWGLLGVSPAYGGQGFPHAVVMACEELFIGANPSFFFYPALCADAGRLLTTFGTDAQRERFGANMFQGRWGGTMCLTEPGAGSDVGASTTKARRLDDGTFAISGTKCFITGGDHDLVENIIHMVLARIEGAPAGTKGLSLFIVPATWVNDDGSLGEPNDVAVGNIESKMGIHGSATCTLNFGENGRCRGLLLGGEEHQGIRQMFQMMNEARLQVGAQGVGIAGVSYYNALQYARERVQGSHYTQFKDPEAPRVAILEHPDVRRMLLQMKSHFEGGRALTLFTALQLDLAKLAEDAETKRLHKGLAELLTPVVKAYNSEMGFQIASVGVQLLGGYGYCMEYPQEQALRDAKIAPIYEGTNHIQAMDLVGRKLAMGGGELFRAFIGLVTEGAERVGRADGLADIAARVVDARDAVVEVTEQFMKAMGEGRMALMPLSANRFCEMVGRLASGWLLAEHAEVATRRLAELGADDPERAFYEGKIASARFFAANVLPELRASAEIVRIGDMTAVEMPDGGF